MKFLLSKACFVLLVFCAASSTVLTVQDKASATDREREEFTSNYIYFGDHEQKIAKVLNMIITIAGDDDIDGVKKFRSQLGENAKLFSRTNVQSVFEKVQDILEKNHMKIQDDFLLDYLHETLNWYHEYIENNQSVRCIGFGDKCLTLNVGGGASSAAGSGFDINENSVITGYFKTTSNRNDWILKAPGSTGVVTIAPGSSDFTLDQGSHNPLTIGTANGLSLSTQVLSLAAATASVTGALTSSDWSLFNSKQDGDATLTALAAYDTNGIVTQTATDTFAGRTIVGTANQVVVTNGDGVAGNPTLALPQDIATSSSPTFADVSLADQGILKLHEASVNGVKRVDLRAPAALVANYTLTLPTEVSSTDEVITADSSGNLSFAKIVNANIDASAAIVDTKLAAISTAGKVLNSATTATSANTASAIVARDSAGNFSAGMITADVTGSVTGAASLNVLKSGDTMTGNLVIDNQKQLRLSEANGNGDNYIALQAPSALAADYTVTLPATVSSADDVVTADGSGNLSFAKIVNANIDASAGIVDTKLATISTAGKVANSATTATSANTADAIVARDNSGDFSAGMITADLTGSVTGAASLNVLKSGDTMTGNLVLDNQKQLRLSEADVNGDNYIALQAPSALAADYTVTLPATVSSADDVVTADGSGNLSFAKIVNANVAASAAIVDTKLATISTAGKVANSSTTATSANTVDAIVARDSSGNFSAGMITAGLTGSVTGAASLNVLKSGDTMTGNLVLDNHKQLRLSEADVNGSNYIALQAPVLLAADYTLTLPPVISSADDVVTADSSGNLSFAKIVNANIDASAAIVDTKLATISTAGKVANSSTTATSANTVDAIVARDSSGDFSAGQISAVDIDIAQNVMLQGIEFRTVADLTDSATVSETTTVYIANYTGILSNFTLTLPASGDLVDGQVLMISSNGTNLATSLVAGIGTNFGGSVQTTLNNRGVTLVYRAADTTWYQVI